MKRIKTHGITPPEEGSLLEKKHFYRIALGNGCIRYFSSKRKAEAFLGDLNRFLDFHLLEANELFIEVFSLYRRYWPYMESGKKADRSQVERDSSRELRTVEEILDDMPRRSRTPSGTWWVFNDLSGVVSSLRKVLDGLEELLRSRSAFAELRKLDSLRWRIDIMERDRRSFGYEDRGARFDEPERPIPRANDHIRFG